MKKNYFLILFVLLSTFALGQKQKYYNDINLDLNGKQLKEQLAELITKTHTRNLSYKQIWDALKNTDLNTENKNEVLLLYGWNTNEKDSSNQARRRNKNKNGGGRGDWNREHTYAKSLGKPNLGTSGPGADAHHLRASDVHRNSIRGNKKFADGSGNSKNVGAYFYPGDEWKGDVARMMMYMYLRYGQRCLPANVGVGSTKNTFDGMIDLFLKWNAEDAVSEIEIQRNEYLGNAKNKTGQGNRNPFIDNPYLATKIWGGPKAQDKWGIDKPASSKKNKEIEASLYPNPSKIGKVYVTTPESLKSITVFSLQGKLIKQYENPNTVSSAFGIDFNQKGIYLIQLESNQNQRQTRKVIIE